MKHPALQASRIGHRHLSGFTLIELMIAITIAVFLVGGLLMMVQSTRNTVTTQTQLAQLQDNERLVLTFMTEVIESTGYFPHPQTYTAVQVMPVAPSFATAGQAVSGTYAGGVAPGDTVTIRYGALLNDDVFNCRGSKNTTVGPYDTFVNTFWINNANPKNPILTCTFSSGAIPLPGVPVPLVNGVQNLAIAYGIKRNPVDTGTCADTYLNASQMLAADWSNVCTIKLIVTFINPLNTGPATIPITRVIAVMNSAGVNT
jgi:type IV pilus assembly protein PilW